MSLSRSRASMNGPRLAKWMVTSAVPFLLANAAFADCADLHMRDETAKKVEILFKNETGASIDLTVQKADESTPNDKKVVQSKTVEAGKKVDYTSTLGDNADKIFYISFGGVSGNFLVSNVKSSSANGVSRNTNYLGKGMGALNDYANITCDTQFKAGRERWSVAIQVN